ncbi:uncharacterized protein RAG0_09420 [Rhynchosporium agropyri]|uniref:Uncharacterized protein n=1 Tax=Rhynchosporium agropyri TaxID=914238 RepID=A0A1E1KVD6_9HELO|nr:uncharacterized protein RAG0_09420 [Rhynchosporium agropyri]
MPDDTSSPPKTPSSPISTAPRRVLTTDESSQLRHRPPTNRFSTSQDAPPTQGIGRRSSNFSEYSLKEARNTFQASTDDFLLPKPGSNGNAASHASSAWDSAPLAFALLPALGGMLFTNGSSVITDVMLLGLAAIFLNWSVRLPWDWYHSAQCMRKNEEYNADTTINEDSEDENPLSSSTATLEEVPEEEDESSTPSSKATRRLPAHEAATNELYTHELLALLSCFLFPALGAYLLHALRGQLTRPSEGLVSNYNLTIFLLASEIRPMAHLVKLIQARTLHLQRIVNANPPYDSTRGSVGEVQDLTRRLEELEARKSITETKITTAEPALSGKQLAVLTTEVRRSLQPDLDALNRAVRRYEKRATLQAFQTESRLHDLESRLNDAISLAAAAANNTQNRRGFSGLVGDVVALPVQAFSAIVSVPLNMAVCLAVWIKGKLIGQKQVVVTGRSERKMGNGRVPTNIRIDRLQGRSGKK